MSELTPIMRLIVAYTCYPAMTIDVNLENLLHVVGKEQIKPERPFALVAYAP